MSSETLVLYGNEEVRTTVIDKQIWWALVDVCKVIGIKNNHDVAKKLDEDEKAEVDLIYPSSNGIAQKRKYLMVNEPGLYHILLTSRSEKAKQFTRWVTHEVLPRIRKYGYYKLTPIEKKAEEKKNLLKEISESLLTLGKSEDLGYYERINDLKELKCEKVTLLHKVYEKDIEEERAKTIEKYPYTLDDLERFGIDVGLAETNIRAMGEDLEKYKTFVRGKEFFDEELFNDKFVKRCKKIDAVLDPNLYRKNYYEQIVKTAQPLQNKN